MPAYELHSTKASSFSYNSAIFASFPNSAYNVFSVNEVFGQFNNNTEQMIEYVNKIQWNGFQNFSWSMTFSDDFNKLTEGSFHRLDSLQCLDAYAQEFQSSTSNLYIVTPINVSYLDPTLPAMLHAEKIPAALPTIDSYSWVCSQFPPTDTSLCADHISSFRANISDWRPFGYQVDYCLAERDPVPGLVGLGTALCRVQVDLSIALIVGIVNLVQVIIMCIMTLRVKDIPLLTHGDAVLSFLEDPDPTTESMSLLEKTDAARFKSPRKKSQPELQSREWLSSPKRFVATRKRWYTAVGKPRWIGFAVL